MSRLFFLILGHLLVVLGIMGALLPILPTTPFLILACGCYGRSSEKFHQLLMGSRWGPLLQNWQKNRSISRRTKYVAVSMLALAIAYSASLVSIFVVQIVLVGIAIGVSVYIITRPSPLRDDQAPAANHKG